MYDCCFKDLIEKLDGKVAFVCRGCIKKDSDEPTVICCRCMDALKTIKLSQKGDQKRNDALDLLSNEEREVK